MRTIFVVVLFFLFTLPTIAQDTRPDCTQSAVAEWMIQRQVGRNKVQSVLSSNEMTVKEAILVVQQARRDLEDLPRPVCADDLYILTIYFYDNLVDTYTFALLGDSMSPTTVSGPRLEKYQQVDPLFEEMQTIAGVDIMVEAEKIVPVPTTVPTSIPVTPMEFNGTNALVIGPVDLPVGLYRARATTDGYMSVAITPTQGECGAGSTFLTPGLFIISQGAAVNGAEALMTSRGCSALIEVSNVQSSWKLTFEKVGEPQ